MPACDGPTQSSNQAKKRGIPGAQVTNRFSSHANSDNGQDHWCREWSPEKPVRNWGIREMKLNKNVVSDVASSTWNSAVWTYHEAIPQWNKAFISLCKSVIGCGKTLRLGGSRLLTSQVSLGEEASSAKGDDTEKRTAVSYCHQTLTTAGGVGRWAVRELARPRRPGQGIIASRTMGVL